MNREGDAAARRIVYETLAWLDGNAVLPGGVRQGTVAYDFLGRSRLIDVRLSYETREKIKRLRDERLRAEEKRLARINADARELARLRPLRAARFDARLKRAA